MIIIRPIITEKSLRDSQKNIFTFEVEKNASKKQIEDEIEKLFQVHVLSVTTVIRKGKSKRIGKKRNVVQKADRKKARVHLQKGEKIEFFEVGESK